MREGDEAGKVRRKGWRGSSERGIHTENDQEQTEVFMEHQRNRRH